jgi:hypothetical protein
MEAKELMIGNYVKDHLDRVQKVSETRSDAYICYLSNGTKLKYKLNTTIPIPLTGDWLLKFGFKKPAHSWICDKFHLSEWDKYPLHWIVSFNKNNAVIVLKLKYVHQLQNLNFALTGEELTIKQ